MNSKRLSILITLAALPLCAEVPNAYLWPAGVVQLAPHQHGPIIIRERRSDGSVTSDNWSGYAVTGAKDSFTYAAGSWTIPTVTCPGTATTYSSFWVGIDGYSSSTVEQTGTDSDCDSGTPSYYVWFEFYPRGSFLVNSVPVQPGDVMFATVTHAGVKFTVEITNQTTGKTFSTSSLSLLAQRSSAEWIAEAPSSGGILPLADFGTILFGSDYTGVGSTNVATESGTTQAIGAFPVINAITMVTSGGSDLAVPSGLTGDGTSFSVAWQ